MISVTMVESDTYEVVVQGQREATYCVSMSQKLYRELCGLQFTHEWVLVVTFNVLLEERSQLDLPPHFDLMGLCQSNPTLKRAIQERL